MLNDVVNDKFPNFQKNMGVHFKNFHKDVGKAATRAGGGRRRAVTPDLVEGGSEEADEPQTSASS